MEVVIYCMEGQTSVTECGLGSAGENDCIAKGMVKMQSDRPDDKTVVAQADGTWAVDSELVQKELVSAVQAKLDSEAQALGYDDINSIAKYMGYVNDFQAECESLGAWTASVWSYCYAQLALVQAGTIDMPTPDELVADLPLRV